jgi:ATP/maltotriose-dependent transcriptional regulator MalT
MHGGLDRAHVVARDRIVARIASAGADVLALVAGAGYGKTTCPPRSPIVTHSIAS